MAYTAENSISHRRIYRPSKDTTALQSIIFVIVIHRLLFLFLFFFFRWVYFPGWHLTSSLIFCHFSLDCTLILRFLHATPATSHSDSSHHLNFGLPLLLSPFPSVLVQTNFFAESLSSILHHLSSPSKSTKLNKLHSITFIIKLIYFRVFAPPPTSIFNYLAEYFP